MSKEMLRSFEEVHHDIDEDIDAVYQELVEERRLFMQGPVVVFRWLNKPRWPVTYVSPNVKQVFGYPAKDFLSGKVQFSKLIARDDFETISQEARRYERMGLSNFEHSPFKIVKADGERIWVSVFTSIVRDDDDEISHYLCYLLDTSRFHQV
ncbi:PAS domain-containing protein [Candidatus Woesearchaeota archaeon]|nr:PAS domain-containing protein [Candidatus Woesearchaeota archaeon]